MARKLKLHEQKQLKKVKNNRQEDKVMKKYYIPKREDYLKYNMLSRKIRDIGNKIINLEASDDFRTAFSARLLEKLYQMGLITTRRHLELVTGVSASSFCRRRLSAVMVRNKMVENIKKATKLIEQGHVRVGSLVVKHPSYLVLRGHEDFVAWVNGSAIRGHNDMGSGEASSLVQCLGHFADAEVNGFYAVLCLRCNELLKNSPNSLLKVLGDRMDSRLYPTGLMHLSKGSYAAAGRFNSSLKSLLGLTELVFKNFIKVCDLQ